MRHKDEIILRKVISEINIAHDMSGMTTLEEFVNDEKLKRAVSYRYKYHSERRIL